MGFTFDDTAHDGVANPISLMHELIAKDARNAERIFPYIGGEEVNNSPTQTPHRYIIDFFDMPLKEAAKWRDLLEIVRLKVKPERDYQKRDALRDRWWQYAEKRPGLRRALGKIQRALVTNCGATPHLAWAFLESRIITAHTLAVITVPVFAAFCALQSRVHEVWARIFSSSMKDDLRYTPTDCFETFPLPEDFEADPRLEVVGEDYYEFRAALMVKNNEGLTKTYNRFHDPTETSPDIQKLRDLHAAMDRAVLDAYGWTDLQPRCEFLLDYEEEEDEDAEDRPAARRRKKPWRYRWPDDFRDTVLARLLELNKQRAEAERLSGAAAEGKEKAKRKGGKKKGAEPGPELY
jgi:hypothetical protein